MCTFTQYKVFSCSVSIQVDLLYFIRLFIRNCMHFTSDFGLQWCFELETLLPDWTKYLFYLCLWKINAFFLEKFKLLNFPPIIFIWWWLSHNLSFLTESDIMHFSAN